MAELTTGQRTELGAKIDEIDVRLKTAIAEAKPFMDALAPYQEKIGAITDEREAILEQYGVQHVGDCEGCGYRLYEGDLGFKYNDDDIYCCDACAPTWRDTLGQYIEFANSYKEDDLENYEASMEIFRAREIAGTLDEPHVWPL